MSFGLQTYNDSLRRESLKGSKKIFKNFLKGIYKRFRKGVKKYG